MKTSSVLRFVSSDHLLAYIPGSFSGLDTRFHQLEIASCSRNGSTLRQGISQEFVLCDSMEHFNFWHMQRGGITRIW